MGVQRRKDFSITGSVNNTVWEDGITSSEAEKKKIVGIVLSVSDHNANLLKGNHEREELISIYDHHLDTDASSGGVNTLISTNKINYIPLDLTLESGKSFNLGIQSGAAATNVTGHYVYELVE